MGERRAVLILVLVLCFTIVSIPQLGIVRAEPKTIIVPEFTVKLVDSSFDVPTSYSIDPYTGENLTHTGYHVESRSIELTIKNQLFVPYYDNSSGWNIRFYYNIRIKGHYSEDWIELYRASDGYTTQSDSEYTTMSYALGENTDTILGTKMITFPAGAQVDFQVEAMMGYVHRDATVTMAPWVFTGEKSDWSETQTVTISARGSQNVASSGLDWAQFATLTLLSVIVVLLVIVVVYLRRRSTK